MIELMGKINVVGDPVMDERAERDGSMRARVEIRARGDVYRADLEYPRGHPGNPMSADEVEDKFRRLTAPLLFPRTRTRSSTRWRASRVPIRSDL